MVIVLLLTTALAPMSAIAGKLASRTVKRLPNSLPKDHVSVLSNAEESKLTEPEAATGGLDTVHDGLEDLFVAKLIPGAGSPLPPLTVEILDASGALVSALTTNQEGWYTPNPLTVRVTVNCPVGGGDCSSDFTLAMDFVTNPGRFYPNGISDLLSTGDCGDDFSGEFSRSSYNVFCPTLLVPEGESVIYAWEFWIQPSENTTLNVQADWGSENASDQVEVPTASIHPVVFVHGILGSMPPSNSIISQWPQSQIILTGDDTWLDPFTGSYSPLITNLLKMGYELEETLFVTTYDWRQSNQLSACWLRDVLQQVPDSGGIIVPDGKADVIVHSMGGMVLRAYLEDMGWETRNADGTWSDPCPYNDDVNKAIFIASPHRGFPVTYNTREGVTWSDYLSTEVDPQSDGLISLGGPSLQWFMDELLWPLLMIKQYEPSILQPCWDFSLNIINQWELISSYACPEEALYYYSHSSDANDGQFRGIRSLAEMLPDEDIPFSYLQDSNGNPYPFPNPPAFPFGREPNPLLDTPFGLNGQTGINTLLSHVPANRIYVIYNGTIDTVESYVVDPAPPPTTPYCFGIIIGGQCIGWLVPSVEPWPVGEPANENKPSSGDDLIPEYSTNLRSVNNGLIPSLPVGNELDVTDGGHKLIASSIQTQNAIAAILTAFDTPENAKNNLTFSITTPYVPPVYGLDNYGAIIAFVFFSPVDGLITDPLGRKIGYEPVSGQVVNEIPGAFYSGNASAIEFILIPGDHEGNYTITTTGTSSGTYAVLAHRVGAAGVQFLGGTQGTAVPGQVVTATVTYAPVIDHIFFEDTEASGPWLAEGGWGMTDEGNAAPPAWASNALTTTTTTPGQPVTLTLTTPLTLTSARNVRLTFQTTSALAAESPAAVELTEDGGITWQTISLLPTGTHSWERRVLDLTPFSLPDSNPVRFRFRLLPSSISDRWVVDDIRVEGLQPPPVFSLPFDDDFESWQRWEASGDWGWVETGAHSPTHAWRSESSGGTLSFSGHFTLTEVTYPQLTFWQTALTDTLGIVEGSSDGQNWTPIYTTTTSTNGWEQASVDLSGYSEESLRLRFRHAGGSPWAIDDVALLNAVPPVIHPLPFSDDMETPTANWQGLNGFTPVTTTAHSGTMSWHSENANSALKLIDRIDLTDTTNPTLTFWHKFDLPAGSLGTLEVSPDGGLSWVSVYTQTISLPDWTQITIDLSAYAGQKIALGFRLQAVGGGRVLLDQPLASVQTNVSEGSFPSGWLVWSVVGLAGLVVFKTKPRSRKILAALAGFALASSCIRVGPSPNYDFNRLDLTLGELELVVPAETRVDAALSPDGRWLAVFRTIPTATGTDGYIDILDLENNQLYEHVGKGKGPIRWLDDQHLIHTAVLSILRVPDMAQWPLEVIAPPAGELGELDAADHIFAVDLTSRYYLTTTDPMMPYLIYSEFQAGPGYTNDALNDFLANRPHTIVRRDPYAGTKNPVYSSDGQYYIGSRPFEDPTHNLRQSGRIIFDKNGQEIAYGYKYGWSAYFLGWAYDGSSAYFLYQPRSADGDLLYQKWPVYKVLVPGAEKRGAPVAVTLTPTPRSNAFFFGNAPVVLVSSNWSVQQFQTDPGWYIDDVSVYDAPATPTATPTNTLTPTPTPTDTPTNTPTATNTPTPTPTTPPSDLIFADSFESGDASTWSSTFSHNSFAITTTAAIVGDFGLLNWVDATNNLPAYVQDDSPTDETSYRARFYFDPHSITMNSAGHILFSAYLDANPIKPVARVTVGKPAGATDYQIQVAVLKDNDDRIISPAYPLTAGPHALEIWWQAASGVGNNDGRLEFWLDGELKYTQTAVDNDTHQVDFVRLGVVNTPDNETLGSHCLDHFESRRTTYIGLASGPVGCGGGILGGEGALPAGASGWPDTLTSPLTQTLFADGFESGDFSAWTAHSPDPDLTVSPLTAISGTYGLAVVVDDYRPVTVQDDTPSGETTYQARFYLDPNRLSLNGGNHTIFQGVMSPSTNVLTVDLGHQPGASEYQIFVAAQLADHDWLYSPAYSLTDGPHAIEIGWGAASAPGLADGWLRLWVDDVLVYEHTQLANDGLVLDLAQLGAVHAPLPGALGTYCLDAFVSTTGPYIGTLAEVNACGAGGLGAFESQTPRPPAFSPAAYPTRRLD
jgi:hypothetical protein